MCAASNIFPRLPSICARAGDVHIPVRTSELQPGDTGAGHTARCPSMPHAPLHYNIIGNWCSSPLFKFPLNFPIYKVSHCLVKPNPRVSACSIRKNSRKHAAIHNIVARAAIPCCSSNLQAYTSSTVCHSLFSGSGIQSCGCFAGRLSFPPSFLYHAPRSRLPTLTT